MKFVSLQAKHWTWIKERAKPRICEDTKGIVAENDDGEILAAAVFDNWSYNSCQIHIAIDNPMVIRHGFLDEVQRYVFETAGRDQLIGITPADNVKALKFNKHAGMKEIFRLKDGYDRGIDFVVTRKTVEDWRDFR